MFWTCSPILRERDCTSDIRWDILQATFTQGTTDKDGYGGNIQISVGIMNDGTVNGISILSIGETAGLGMRATEPEFYNQYAEKKTDKFYVAKDGGENEPDHGGSRCHRR